MVISADFEKQKQYFEQENIASSILHYHFIAILLVKIARLTRVLSRTKQICELVSIDIKK
jgi:hypothetical protein